METRTSGSEGGLRKRTGRKTGTAPQPDPYDGVVVLQGQVERRSMLPFLVRAVRGVEGVVRVEDRLAYDLDDRDADWVLVSPWMHL